ncbi:MAG TPA: aminoglycoside phosphotransferase family protein [Puia sp.]|nr:aminoglycoside phosphotransferase family protein [Puia sp.]
METLKRVREKWSLSEDGEIFMVGNSLLQPVVVAGKAAMLKIPLKKAELGGFRLLAAWNGIAAVKVYQFDAEALLMERATGDRSLKRMTLSGREEEVNRIICAVVKQLHANPCTGVPGLVPLETWFRSLYSAAARDGGFFGRAQSIVQQLLATPLDAVALHGDIHHENILDGGARGWLVIDPKGLIGERGFDYANIFCNPDLTVAGSPERLSSQVRLMARLTQIPVDRLLRWIVAWSALMASWMLEDGEDPVLPFTVGAIAERELGDAGT